ncbi:MAG: transketolase C-terminal domain-containing protein [Desulfuromonadaceae bacterium]|nr:transketolase C-terminal domain-containing protein [Desulfuromonadaceae bacterium]
MRNSDLYLHELNAALLDAMESDSRVYLMGEDILDPYGGAFKVTAGLSSRFPERVIGTPISEACITGIGVGMALRGLIPIIEIMFGDFLTLAADQIINHAAKFRKMYNSQVSVPMVIRTPMGGGRGYGPTHSQSLEKMFLGIPGLNVVSPSIFHNVRELLRYAIFEDKDPTLFIEHKLLYSTPLQSSNSYFSVESIPTSSGFPVAVVNNFDHGTPDVTIVSYGGSSRLLIDIMKSMRDEEIKISACYPSLISNGIAPCITKYASLSQRVIIIEEGAGPFGWGAEIASQIYDQVGSRLVQSIRRIQTANAVIPSSKELEYTILPNRESIERAIEEVLT